MFLRTLGCLFLLTTALRAQSPGNWTLSRTNLPNVTHSSSIAYGNGRFVITTSGDYGALRPAWTGDGLTWNSANSAAPLGDFVIFLAGAFYLTTGNGLYRSTDGEAWERLPAFDHLPTLLRVVHSDGRGFLFGPVAGIPLKMIYSPDRLTARQTASLPLTEPPAYYASQSEIAYVNGRYFTLYTISGSDGKGATYAASTTDGSAWTPSVAFPLSNYLAAGGGRMLATTYVGTRLAVRVTTNGDTFTTFLLPADSTNGGPLRYAGGRFFCLDTLIASVEGTQWALLAAPLPPANVRDFSSISYGNGRYIAVGNHWVSTGSTTIKADSVGILVIPAAAPVIATGPLDRTVPEGWPHTFTVTLESPVSGTTFQWQRNGTNLPGATNSTYSIAAAKPADAGNYTVVLRTPANSLTTTSDVAVLTLGPPLVAPAVSTAPANLTVLAGAKTTLGVTATGTAPLTYQWLRNGTPLAGATAATLTFEPALVTDAAAYSVTVTNAAGSVTTGAATLSVTAVSRLSNLSVLTALAAPGDTFTLGYVVSSLGSPGSKPFVLRAAGPSLVTFGLAGTLDDPKLELFAGAFKTFENDNWGTITPNADSHSAVGAFPYTSLTSKDAAVTFSVASRDNSMKVSAANATSTGLVLAEVYDATPAAAFTTATPRLLNVSVLKSLGTVLTVGFTLAGSTPKTVLIRAIGPTLGDFGVPGTVADPQLALFASGASSPFSTNDNWGGTTALTTAFSSVGAFTLPPTSKDAALLATLLPGGYTVQVSGVANTTGTALVEVYEVP